MIAGMVTAIDKLEDWKINLHLFLVQHKDYEFAWGSWDCCRFTDAAVLAMTGQNLVPKELRWHDRKTAIEVIRKNGDNFPALAKSILMKAGLQPVEKPQLGDVTIYKKKDFAIGIYDGFVIRAPSDKGTAAVAKFHITESFRIK